MSSQKSRGAFPFGIVLVGCLLWNAALLRTSAPPPPPGCPSTTTTFSNTTSLVIPTGPGVVSSTIVVGGVDPFLWDVDLRAFITHTNNTDLDITIQSPAGTVVTLTTDNGAGNDNVYNGTLWDDDANPLGQVPYATNNGLTTDHAYVNLVTATPLAPEEALAAFLGENPNGPWTLTISDDLALNGGTLSGWSLDVTTLAVVPAASSFSATNTTPVTIPTTAPPIVLSSTIAISGADPHLCDVNVRTTLTHTFAGDLDITLMSPAGTVATLTTDNGAGNDNVYNGTLWDDDANPAGQVPYVNNNGLATDHLYANLVLASPLAPEEPLGAFIGENPNGVWTLTISDDANGDGGTLSSWTLEITTCTCGAATGACCFPNGQCNVLTPTSCAAQGGTYLGDNVPCSPSNPCPQPIHDRLYTADPTSVGFGLGGVYPPIPPSFFDPGSDPFQGTVPLLGRPLNPTQSNADTVVRRHSDPVLPADPPGTMGTIPIEIIQLSLVSINPITVTYGGANPQMWDVRVGLSVHPSPRGPLTATKTHPNGGTFDAILPVRPLLTFTQVGNPGNVRVLDTGAVGLPPLQMQIVDAPFVHMVNPALELIVDPLSQWMPGVVENVPGDPGSQARHIFCGNAQPDAIHCVCPAFKIGACCYPDGSCQLTFRPDCEATGGIWQGANTDCGQIFYPQPVTWPPGFMDIATPANRLAQVVGDDAAQAVTIPFPFYYYGNARNNGLVSTNGFMTFGTNGTAFSNGAIPSVATPNDAIYALWDDLIVNVGEGDAVYAATMGAAPDRMFIVQWMNVNQLGQTDSNTFQIKLFESSNCIEFHYLTITPEAPAGDYTVGVENATGTAATSVPGASLGTGNRRLVWCPAGMRCPQPVGACCLPDGTCVTVTRAECQARCGEYQGDDTSCDTVVCPQPRCIYRVTCIDGDCENCPLSLGQLVVGPPCPAGSTCPPSITQTCGPPPTTCCVTYSFVECRLPQSGEPPIPPGVPCECPRRQACCFLDGSCLDLQPGACTAQGGTPQGPGTSCATVTCPQPTVCIYRVTCIDGDCANCPVMLGDLVVGPPCVPPGTNCPPVITQTCGPAGDACCVEYTFVICRPRMATDLPMPPGVPCECPRRQACCFPDGSCADLQPGACVAAGGMPQGLGTSCATVTCPQPERCIYRVTCIDGDCANCPLMLGDLVVGPPCTPPGTNCPPVITRTCGTTFDACCVEYTFVQCRPPQAGEPPMPPGVPCECPQRQACCFTDGSCLDLQPGACVAAGGMPQGLGSSCATVVCPQPTFCIYRVTCIDGDCANCPLSLGDLVFGPPCTPPGTNCPPVITQTCGQAADACCVEYTFVICRPRLATDLPMPPGVPCECPRRRACCFPDGSCLDLQPGACVAQGGTPQAAGTSCATVTCPRPPVCIYRVTCVDGDCENCPIMLGQLVFGPPCPAGTNCPPVITRTCGNLEACCIEYTFVECRPRLASDVPMPPGSPCECVRVEACCFTDGSCLDLAPNACVAQGGTPQGPGTSCATVTCPQPARCIYRVTCMEGDCANCPITLGQLVFGPPCPAGTVCPPVITRTCGNLDTCCIEYTFVECRPRLPGEIPMPPGFPCECVRTEACCFPSGGCLDLTPSDCTAQGGTPQGPGTSCATVTCPQERCIYRVICMDGDCANCPVMLGDLVIGPPCPPGTNCPTLIMRRCGTFADACCVAYVFVVCRPPLPNEIPMPPGQPCDCPPREACCLPSGICVDVSPQECHDRCGRPQGPGTNCVTTTCGPCVGDINGDGLIDLGDLALMLSSFGFCQPHPLYLRCADFDGDGCNDLDDLAVLLSNFGTVCPWRRRSLLAPGAACIVRAPGASLPSSTVVARA